MTAARVTCGAICLSSSSHLPLKLYSQFMKPVMLPPGRDRLSTKPAPTGSAAAANTIGKVRVTRSNAVTLTVASAKRMSGVSATNSCAYPRARSASFSCQRMSIRTLRPSFQPDFLQGLLERCDLGLAEWIVCGQGQERANAPHPLGLLRARRERPRRHRANKCDDEFSSPD